MKVLLALAIIGGLGWLAYDYFQEEDVKAPAPVQVEVNVPQPFGGEPPPGDRIYVP